MLRTSTLSLAHSRLSISDGSSNQNHLLTWGTLTASLLLLTLMSLGSPPVFGQCGTTWQGPATGNWSTSGNWTAGVPTPATNVCVDNGNGQHSAVTLDVTGQAANLTITTGDSLSFNDNTSLTINSTSISNAGNIFLNSGGNNTNLILAGNNTVTLSGGGTVTLDNLSTNRIYSAGGGGVLINQETIQGAGQIGVSLMSLRNSGTINANVSNTLFIIPNSGGVTNTGTLEATAGGTLDLQGIYTNTGGTLNASGTSSVIILHGSTINGGTLSSSSSGTISSISGTLNGVTLTAGTNFVNSDNTNTSLQGTITNRGTISLNSGGNNTDLRILGPVTLKGIGIVNMGNSGTNRIYSQSGSDTLTLQQVIQGAGQIGVGLMGLVNQSTINSNFTGSTLTIHPNGTGVSNTGAILEATNGGVLTLLSGTFTNTGGTIQALNSASGTSTVQVSGSAINGGTLTTTGNGVIQNANSTTLNGVTFSTGSNYVNPDNTATTLIGTITNNGTIALNSGGNNTDLRLNGAVTFAGTGTISMGNSGANRIYGQNGTDTLTIQQFIQGAGQLGVGLTTLVNQSTVNSNFTGSTLTISPNGSGLTNNGGILQATNGGILLLTGSYDNTGGKIRAINATTASTVNLSSATITGGTLTTTGNGVIRNLNTTSLSGVTFAAGTNFAVNDNTSTFLQGTIINNGTFSVNSAGNNTNIQISGPVTLTGTGTVNLSNVGTNRIYAPNGSDTLTIQQNIQGAGQIGVGLTNLINQSVINANGSATLTINPNSSGLTNNTGIVEATTGGTLDLIGLYKNGGGTIQALAGSLVKLDAATVQNGTLTTVGTGAMQIVNSSTLNGVKVSGGSNLTLLDNRSATLIGTITDDGTINQSSGGNNTDILISGPVTLAGVGGHLTLSNVTTNRIFAPNGTDVLTNKTTIQGAGQIGIGLMGLVNNGTIIANQSAGLVISTNSAGLNNTGTLSVTSGNAMRVTGGPFLNFSGGTLTGGSYLVGGTLKIDELGTTGGEITTDAANITLTGASSSFIDSASLDALSNLNTIAAGGGFTVTGGRNFTTVGNFTNNGALTVGATSKFTVNGNLTNFVGTKLTGGTYNVTGTLQFNGANIVTNAANITLTGVNSKIVNQTGITDALRNFATNAATGTFALASSRNFTTAGNFTNNGVLTVGAGSKFNVNGNLTNFAGTTLTGGTYNVTGTLQFNGANIVKNAANITLSGAVSKIVDQTGTTNGLANFAVNAQTASFTLASGRNFTTAGAFTNAGAVKVSAGTAFTVASGKSYTQVAGTTTNSGTMSVSGGGVFAINTGSVFGNAGTFSGNLISGGTVNMGNALNLPGKLAVTGKYTQNSTGILAADIGGATAGTQFDQLNVTGAVTLGGTLNLQLINSFVPTIGSTFDIMNFASSTGTFATINGTHINPSEHFAVTVNPTNVTLSVVAGPSFGDDSFSTTASPSPEPASLLLMGSGLVGIFASRRRLKNSSK